MINSANYLKLDIHHDHQMQDADVLHLMHQALPFSEEIIRYKNDNEKSFSLLLEVPSRKISIRDFIALKNESMPKKKIQDLLNNFSIIIFKQLLYAEGKGCLLNTYFLNPDLMFIDPELKEIDPDSSISNDLKKLTWFCLNKSLDVSIDTIHFDIISVWQYFTELAPQQEKHYQLLEDYVAKENFQMGLDNCLNKRNLQHDKIIPQKSIDLEEKTRKKQDFRKKTFGSKFATLKRKLAFNFRQSDIEQREITIPLNPSQDLFRIAVLSEGAPGTIEESQGPRIFILVDEFLIGRDKSICDFSLAEKTIGRLHARISRHGSHYFIEDLGSKNGSFLNGKKLNKYQTYLLPDQCRLRFAELNFYFTLD